MSPIGLGQWPMMSLVILLRMAGTIEISGLAQNARNRSIVHPRLEFAISCRAMSRAMSNLLRLLRTTRLQRVDQNIDYFGGRLPGDYASSQTSQRRGVPGPKKQEPRHLW